MRIKLGKTLQHHNWPRCMDWPQLGPKLAIKQGKNRQKDKWYLFRAPTCSLYSGPIRPRQGTEICNFGAPSPLEALHWIFCSFSRFYVQFSKKSPRKSGESSEKSSGENRVKSCHVCGCHGFFGPDLCPKIGTKYAVK